MGNVGVDPTAYLHLAAGTATANTSPLKLTSGTPLIIEEDGALEYHSSHLYFTIGSTRYQLDQQSGGDFSSNTSTSVDSEVVLFSGTAGKTGKRATGTGVAHLTSGVLSVSNVDLTSEVTGNLPVTNLNSGTSASSSTFWRGDSTWTAPTNIYNGDGTLSGDRSLSGNAHTLSLGTSGSKVSSFSVWSSGGVLLEGTGSGASTWDPGSGATLSLGNAAAEMRLAGNITFSTVVTATDANLALTKGSVVILPTITANRTFQLDLQVAGQIFTVMNRNTSGNTWSTTGFTIKDAAGSTISSLVNSTVYMLMYDGTNAIKIN